MANSRTESDHKQPVYQLYRWTQRYEYTSDGKANFAAGPPKYTKNFVGGGRDEESCGFFNQLRLLEMSPNCVVLRGTFEMLKDKAANHSRKYRGYLLGPDLQPATVKAIGQWQRYDHEQIKSVLDELCEIGLLEYVEMPVFEDEKTVENDVAPESPGIPGDSGENPENPSKNDKAKDKSTSDNGKNKEKDKKKTTQAAPVSGKGKTKPGGKAPPGKSKSKPQGKQKASVAKGTGKAKDNAKASTEGHTEAESTTVPPTETSLLSKVSPGADAGGDATKPGTDAGGGSGSHPDPSTSHQLESVMGIGAAPAFAGEIYEALGIPVISGEVNRRELGNYRSAWSNALDAGLKLSQLVVLWDKSVAEAKSIARKRRGGQRYRKDPYGAVVWRGVFDKRLKKMKAARDKPG